METMNPPAHERELIAVVEQDIKREVGDAIETARAIAAAIKDSTTRAQAIEVGISIAAKIKGIEAKRDDVVPPLRKAYERVRDLFDDPLKKLKACRDALRSGISTYDVEIERQARLERERQEAERRRQQEEYERKKREYEEAVRRQQEEDRRRLAEIEAAHRREQEERDRKIKEEEDARLRHAEEAKKQGNADRVDHILENTTPIAPAPKPLLSDPVEAPLAVLPPPPLPPPPAALTQEIASFAGEGTIRKNVWKCEVSDLKEFLAAVVDGRIPMLVEYRGKRVPIVEVHTGYLDSQVKALKDEFRCPGVRAWSERQTDFKISKSNDGSNP